MSKSKITIRSPDFEKAFRQTINKVQDNMDVPLSKYMLEVIEQTKNTIIQREGWSQGPGSIFSGIDVDVSGNVANITNSAPHAFLRQWGETETGKTVITKKDKKLFINKTGLSTEDFKNLDPEDRRAYTYGIDYWFADFVRIVANPYIAIPGISDEARNKIAGYQEDSTKSEAAMDKFEEAIFQVVSSILRSISYDYGIQR